MPVNIMRPLFLITPVYRLVIGLAAVIFRDDLKHSDVPQYAQMSSLHPRSGFFLSVLLHENSFGVGILLVKTFCPRFHFYTRSLRQSNCLLVEFVF